MKRVLNNELDLLSLLFVEMLCGLLLIPVLSGQYRVCHISSHVPSIRTPGGQNWEERHLGPVCSSYHPRVPHGAGLHLLEPVDRYGD